MFSSLFGPDRHLSPRQRESVRIVLALLSDLRREVALDQAGGGRAVQQGMAAHLTRIRTALDGPLAGLGLATSDLHHFLDGLHADLILRVFRDMRHADRRAEQLYAAPARLILTAIGVPPATSQGRLSPLASAWQWADLTSDLTVAANRGLIIIPASEWASLGIESLDPARPTEWPATALEWIKVRRGRAAADLEQAQRQLAEHVSDRGAREWLSHHLAIQVKKSAAAGK